MVGKLRKYKVYTKQINADAIEVEALNEYQARWLAQKIWEDNYGFEVKSVEDIGEVKTIINKCNGCGEEMK